MMIFGKRNLLFILISNVSFTVAALADDSAVLNDRLKIDALKDGVYVVSHSLPWPANSVVVRCSDRDFVWADTPYTNAATEAVLDWLKQKFGAINLIEINTGFHVDNLGGNAVLIENKIPVIGSELTCRLLKERGESTQSQILGWLGTPEMSEYRAEYEKMEFLAPTSVIKLEGAKKITVGDEVIELFYPGPSHSPDNIVVFFPGKNVLFGGCMVKELKAKNAGFTGDADMERWPASLGMVLDRYRGAAFVIPGHGKTGDTSLIRHTIGLLR